MLKIKDNVDLKELEKYGFEMFYNKYTGEVEDIYLPYGFLNNTPIIHFKKRAKLIFRNVKDKRGDGMRVEVPNNLTAHNRFLNVLYDLIKADLIEKVED
jgi:hypothetical protein